MTRPTADSTAVADSWLRSHRDLHSLLDEALEDPEIAEALERESIPPAEARAVILEDPNVLAELRATREWRKVLRAVYVSSNDWGLRSKRLARVSPSVRIAVAVLAVIVYVGMLFASWPVLPWWGNLLGAAGLVGTVGFAAGIAGEETLSVFIAVRTVRDPASWRWYALDEVVLPRLRQFIDERLAPDFGTTLSLLGVHNLYQDENDAPVIITSAGQRLRRIMERSTSDAVAVAGYRGVGKSTAIRAASHGMFSDPSAPPPLRVIASAPSRYEARDFVLHLYAVLAKQVIELTGTLLRMSAPPERSRVKAVLSALLPWFTFSAVLPAALLGIAFLVAGEPFPRFIADLRDFVAAVPESSADRPAYQELDGGSAFLVVMAALLAALSMFSWGMRWLEQLIHALRRTSRARTMPEVAALRADAMHQLDRIRFLQTYTSGWSGKVGLPLGSSDVGWARGRQRAEQQLTHPEVVEAFREFAGWAAAVLTGEGAIERILIAVDELDKIAEPDKANEFVNDIKGIFGIDGCLFLVAVSEDAVSAFERRGIPVRDAVDSAFSEVIRMDAFTLAESRRWMGRRLLGVPEPFSCLCHCLSGGLPRDLRRTTVDMIDVVRETDSRDLGSVATSMVDRELDRKAHAFAAAMRRLDDTPEVAAHLTDLLLITRTRTTAELVGLAARLAPDESSAMPRMRWQNACFVLFCATVREVFTNGITASDLGEGVELLGTARAQLAVDPHVAWRVVCDVRDRYGAMPVPGRSGPP